MNFRTIIDAWKIANDPTPEQIELSIKRMEICKKCESLSELIKGLKISTVCTECGCPISKKVFTDIFNSCPLEKWADCDMNYFEKQKTNKTLI
jgi:hypothetical protein